MPTEALPIKFTIRIYGILMDSAKRVLLSDEFIRGQYFTKFPGGGLELGEGTRDCLRREFKEETGLNVLVSAHIYTTDYYQRSAFNPQDQVLSIYYFVEPLEPPTFIAKTKPFDFEPQQVADAKGQSEVFRWIDWNDLDEHSVSLPIDKIVVKLLKEQY
jgi:8-oxo-dGTP pyrophosphatase MutT (NUDIX family)